MKAHTTALPPARSVVVPGNYDGVHLGHRALLEAARRLAASEAVTPRIVALTFDPHPLSLVAPERAPPLLSTPERRAELLRAAGADAVLIRTFDAEFSALSPEAFVDQVLLRQLHACGVVVGTDFRFGAGRAGDGELLRTLGAARGMRMATVSPVTLEGQLVSSSQIRAAIAAGDVGLAARMLTRIHDVEGRVVQGDQRGRTLGFPTANLELVGLMPPADGVYAVAVRILDARANAAPTPERLLGVANLGVRPTCNAGRSMEVHVLDFNGNLYDHHLRVGFVERLRGEQKFSSLDALKTQIRRDADCARTALAACAPELLAWI